MRTIFWNNKAAEYFFETIGKIEESSPLNAQKVAEVILNRIESAAEFPEHQRRDKYKQSNDRGLFRAFELYAFRFSFYFDDNVVRIVRVRHTGQKPFKY